MHGFYIKLIWMKYEIYIVVYGMYMEYIWCKFETYIENVFFIYDQYIDTYMVYIWII